MRYLYLHIIVLLVLVGCASAPSKLSPAERQYIYHQTQAKLETIQKWEMHGRFNMYHRGKSNTFNITWLQEPTAYGIKVAGSLGHGAIYLLGDENGVTYKDNDGNVDTAPTPESLLQVYTGLDLPVSNLHYWLLTRPAPAVPQDVMLNPRGYVVEMQQDLWQITYQNYRKFGDIYLPTRILLKHPDDLRITLSVHDWDIPA